MTRVLELPPELEARLQVLAGERGATPEEVALQVLEAGLLSDEELDERLDELDAAELRGAAEESEPDIAWEDIKAELRL